MAVQIQIRRGTTAQWAANNPILATGELGLDTDLDLFKIGDGITAWTSLAFFSPGAKGTPGNNVFYENDQTVTGSYSITSGKNAMSAGPITINSGVTVTVPSGSVWTIV